jgi:excisionase family DNA binding protein
MTATRPTYLRAGQVAKILLVSPKTISRWAAEGKLPHQRTLGGHRRYREADIRELIRTLDQTGGQGGEAGNS